MNIERIGDSVESVELDSTRVMLRVRSDADLVQGVTEIRNACWDAIGLQFAFGSPDPGMLYFEGIPDRFNFGSHLQDLCQRMSAQNQSEDSATTRIAPQSKQISSADSGSLDERSVENLTALVQAWRRVATSWTPDEVNLPDHLIDADLIVGDSGYSVVHGGAPSLAVEALDRVLESDWTTIFRLPELISSPWQAGSTSSGASNS